MCLRSFTRLVLACSLAGSVACDNPLQPSDVAGAYLLRTVRGDPIPALLWQAGGASMRLLSDTLVLNGDGTGYEVWHTEFTDQLRITTGRSEHPFRFEIHDGQLEGAYVCPPETA